MKWAIGDRLLGLTSKVGGSAHRTAKDSVEEKGANSKLYFIKSQKHVIDTADTSQFSTKEVTVIYLSFTNVRISITLPGGGVSLKGRTGGTYSRR